MILIMIMIGFDSICLNGRKDGRFCFSRRGAWRGPPILKGACKGSIVGMQPSFGGLHISWETSTAPPKHCMEIISATDGKHKI